LVMTLIEERQVAAETLAKLQEQVAGLEADSDGKD